MKISTNNIMNKYSDLRLRSKDNSVSYTASGEEHNYDEIIIHSNPREIEERSFSKALSEKISAEVRITASPEKILNLQNQIQAQTYQIDPYAVASRILLL